MNTTKEAETESLEPSAALYTRYTKNTVERSINIIGTPASPIWGVPLPVEGTKKNRLTEVYMRIFHQRWTDFNTLISFSRFHFQE